MRTKSVDMTSTQAVTETIKTDAQIEAELKALDPFANANEPGSMSQLQKILANNDACAFKRFRFERADLIRALMNTPDVVAVDSETDRTLFDLFDTTAGTSDTLATPHAESNNINSFMNALYFSGQLYGSTSTPRDDEYALSLLDRLAADDPQNGAFDYFSVIPLQRLGYSEFTIKERFRIVFQNHAGLRRAGRRDRSGRHRWARR